MMNKAGQPVFDSRAASKALQIHGANVKLAINSQRAIAAELSPSAVKALRKDSRVALVEQDASRHMMTAYSDSAGNPNNVQVTPYAIIQS